MIELLTHDLELRQPWFLLAVLAAPLVWWMAARGGGRIVFSSLAALPRAAHSWRAALSWLPDAMLAGAAAALALALAGPRIADRATRVEREGIAIMMVVDTSGSMLALDLSTESKEQNRLDAVKSVFEEFVLGGNGLAGRPDDAIGIVSFAGYADTRCPLTLDHGSLVSIARDLEIVSDRSEDGTAVGEGLGLAVLRLRDAENKPKSKVAIVLTDGVNNAGEMSPVAAAELARQEKIKVYTIGAGTNGMAKIKVQDPFSGREVVDMVKVQIDEEMLRDVAQRTGGKYFRATDAAGLRQVYAEIDRLERSRISEVRYRQYRELYQLCVAIALGLATIGWLLRGTVFRRLP